MVEIIPAPIISEPPKCVKDQDCQNYWGGRLRKDWLLARQIARIEAVGTPEATNIKIPAVVPLGFEAGMGTCGWAAKHWVALLGTAFFPRLR